MIDGKRICTFLRTLRHSGDLYRRKAEWVRDKINLDILIHSLPLPQPLGLPVWFAAAPRLQLWLKDESLEDSANLPAPEIIAAEIVEDLEAALQQFATIAQDLKN